MVSFVFVQQDNEAPSVDSFELASTLSELPSAPILPPLSASVLQQSESMKRVGSVTNRMLSNPEPCAVSPQSSETSLVSSQGMRSRIALTEFFQ